MKILNGKFYDENNNIVKLEFGNKTQIKLIKEKEKLMEKLENSFPGKINNHVYYKAVIDFECPSCKRNTSYEDDEFTEFESDVNDFKNSVIHCEHCNTEYEIVDGKRNEVNLKLYE